MLDTPHAIYFIILIVCVICALVYLTTEYDLPKSRHERVTHTPPHHLDPPPGYVHTGLYTCHVLQNGQPAALREPRCTDSVLPSYVESRSVTQPCENVLHCPFAQRTNNVMQPEKTCIKYI